MSGAKVRASGFGGSADGQLRLTNPLVKVRNRAPTIEILKTKVGPGICMKLKGEDKMYIDKLGPFAQNSTN